MQEVEVGQLSCFNTLIVSTLWWSLFLFDLNSSQHLSLSVLNCVVTRLLLSLPSPEAAAYELPQRVSLPASFQPSPPSSLCPPSFLFSAPVPCCSRLRFCSDSQPHHFLQILHLKAHLTQKPFQNENGTLKERKWWTGKLLSASALLTAVPPSAL